MHKKCRMKHQEDITLQFLVENEGLQIGYSDNDILVVDSIQRFEEIKNAHVGMNSMVLCTNGKVQAQINGVKIELYKNQVCIIPQNIMATDLMVSPDFDMKAIFLTNNILQSFLREKMSVWNDLMYVHRQHIMTLSDADMLFFTHFYDMLSLAVERGQDRAYRTDVIQSLLRAAILALCGELKQMLPSNGETHVTSTYNSHFQRFLSLLHSSEVKYRPVKAYASDLCISPKYLTVICKKNSGKTATEWIQEHVLEDIRNYLKQTDLSIKQISDCLGFPNTSFFCKYVKEHFGIPPKRFREQ